MIIELVSQANMDHDLGMLEAELESSCLGDRCGCIVMDIDETPLRERLVGMLVLHLTRWILMLDGSLATIQPSR